VEVLDAVVVAVFKRALGDTGFVGLLDTDTLVERVLVLDAVAEVDGTTPNTLT